ncbi:MULTISPECIES: hypothetical protein [unclassified Spirosoma]|uniref:hypothetical protein n=1 Tax=unclassified Spirosoma TaxID=2621999 RepID=UPI000965284C|nr:MULTISPECIES: hypothetical protein [unclassified Spirosoma]MBN8826692.1 hypothetical protein [Spirosoma sp.]OJW75057.1 MAG: hypothetical protein BGO59_18960 [Spirosoma sp. 48-14]
MNPFVAIRTSERTNLINIDHVKKLEPLEGGQKTLVVLRSGSQLRALIPYKRLVNILQYWTSQENQKSPYTNSAMPSGAGQSLQRVQQGGIVD